MPEGFRILKLTHPEQLDDEELRFLFKRAFSEPRFRVNADELIDFVKEQFAGEDCRIHVWVGMSDTDGACGLGIVTTWTYPLAPYPWIVHFHSEIKHFRSPLLFAMFDWLQAHGHNEFFTHNVSHLNDRAFAGLFSNWATAEVLGSLVLIEMR